MNSNTPTPKLGEDVINQIKDFEPNYEYNFPFYDIFTKEQKSLIDELIPNEELRERYKKYGLCKECSQPNTDRSTYLYYPYFLYRSLNSSFGINSSINDFCSLVKI